MLSQANISATTPTGTHILPDGTCFKVWAPRATAVYLNGIFGGNAYGQQTDDRLLPRGGGGDGDLPHEIAGRRGSCRPRALTRRLEM